MPIETAADRLVFLSVEEFGAEGTYAPAAGGGSTTIAGIFDRPSISTDLNQVASLDARPTFCCRAADLPAGADGDAGDQLTVTGEGAFEVVSIEPDGQGMALLRLGALA
ncbi:head-tail joining protein [Bradyrhizobium tunisiense]|uniref:head-tail joining protein n=1 Tax=Bradyrhizobium tunisiense TaxID=3278709 RepID=UPI0035DFB79A